VSRSRRSRVAAMLLGRHQGMRRACGLLDGLFDTSASGSIRQMLLGQRALARRLWHTESTVTEACSRASIVVGDMARCVAISASGQALRLVWSFADHRSNPSCGRGWTSPSRSGPPCRDRCACGAWRPGGIRSRTCSRRGRVWDRRDRRADVRTAPGPKEAEIVALMGGNR